MGDGDASKEGLFFFPSHSNGAQIFFFFPIFFWISHFHAASPPQKFKFLRNVRIFNMREKGLLFVFSLSTLNDTTINDFLFSFFVAWRQKLVHLAAITHGEPIYIFSTFQRLSIFPLSPRMCRINVLLFFWEDVGFDAECSEARHIIPPTNPLPKWTIKNLRGGEGHKKSLWREGWGWDRRREKVPIFCILLFPIYNFP